MATYEQLVALADEIRQAVAENSVTAPQVGKLFKDVMDYIHQRVADIAKLNSDLSKLQSDLKVLERDSALAIDQLTESLESLGKELASAKSDIVNVRNMVSSLSGELLSVKTDLSDFKEETAEAIDQLTEAMERGLANTKKDIDDVHGLVSSLSVELSSFKSDFEDFSKDASQTIDELTTAVDDIDQNVKDNTEKLSELEEDIDVREGNAWMTASQTFAVNANYQKHMVFVVKEGDTINIKPNTTNPTYYAFLSSYTKPTNGSPTYSIGERVKLDANTVEKTLTVPSGAMYLYVQVTDVSKDYLPSLLKINGYDLLSSIRNNIIDSVKEFNKNTIPQYKDGLINAKGLWSDNKDFSCAIIGCSFGDVFEIYGQGGTSASLCYILDGEKNALYSFNESINSPVRISIDSKEAKYITFTSRKSKIGYYIKRVSLSESLSAISENVSDLLKDSDKSNNVVNKTNEVTKKLSNKRVAIIGDSISTFAGENNYYSGGQHYPNVASGVDSANKTWWKIILDRFGWNVSRNLSYAGSCVGIKDTLPTLCGRVDLLPKDSTDVVIIALGYNDSVSNSGISLGNYEFDKSINDLSESVFREAYIKGIKKIKDSLPNADIICVAMKEYQYGYCDSIKMIAEHFGCFFVDVRGYVNYDNIHPNVIGMKEIASSVQLRQILEEINIRYNENKLNSVVECYFVPFSTESNINFQIKKNVEEGKGFYVKITGDKEQINSSKVNLWFETGKPQISIDIDGHWHYVVPTGTNNFFAVVKDKSFISGSGQLKVEVAFDSNSLSYNVAETESKTNEIDKSLNGYVENFGVEQGKQLNLILPVSLQKNETYYIEVSYDETEGGTVDPKEAKKVEDIVNNGRVNVYFGSGNLQSVIVNGGLQRYSAKASVDNTIISLGGSYILDTSNYFSVRIISGSTIRSELNTMNDAIGSTKSIISSSLSNIIAYGIGYQFNGDTMYEYTTKDGFNYSILNKPMDWLKPLDNSGNTINLWDIGLIRKDGAYYIIADYINKSASNYKTLDPSKNSQGKDLNRGGNKMRVIKTYDLKSAADSWDIDWEAKISDDIVLEWAGKPFVDDNGKCYMFITCGYCYDSNKIRTATDSTGAEFYMKYLYLVEFSDNFKTAASAKRINLEGGSLDTTCRIDAFVTKKDGSYYLFIKNEYTRSIEEWKSNSIDGGYVKIHDFQDQFMEAPCCFYLNGLYYLWVYNHGSAYNAVYTSPDMENWSDMMTVNTNNEHNRIMHSTFITMEQESKDYSTIALNSSGIVDLIPNATYVVKNDDISISGFKYNKMVLGGTCKFLLVGNGGITINANPTGIKSNITTDITAERYKPIVLKNNGYNIDEFYVE